MQSSYKGYDIVVERADVLAGGTIFYKAVSDEEPLPIQGLMYVAKSGDSVRDVLSDVKEMIDEELEE